MKPTFIISSPFDTYSGYGARSRDLIKAIIATDKYNVKLLSQRWGNTPFGFCKDNPEWGSLLDLITPQPLTQKPDIWAQITVPNEFHPLGKYNIGFTAGMETTLVHGSWTEGMNRMDINFVSSEHSKKAFMNSEFEKRDNKNNLIGKVKIEKPIEVLFEGIDLDVYKPTNDIFDLSEVKEQFAYLFVGHWMQGDMGEDRKNVGLLIKAFYETFKNKSKKPALILKTSTVGASYMDRDAILNKIRAIQNTVGSKNLPNIYLLHGEFTNEEMNQIYNHPKVKSFVSFTKGEGFGRPLLEFTQTKKPVIASNWSGQVDFLNSEFTSLVPGNLTPIHPSAQVKDMLIENSKWFTPDLTQVAHHFHNCYINYKDYKKGAKSQQYKSKANFSWKAMKQELESILNNIPKIEAIQPMQLQLPKLKKIGEQNQELPKIQLPKLKKL